MKRFKSILVAVDTRLEEHPELQWAVRLAEHHQPKLKIVDVVPEFSWLNRLVMPDSDHTQQVLADDKRRNLEALARPLRDRGFDVTTQGSLRKNFFRDHARGAEIESRLGVTCDQRRP